MSNQHRGLNIYRAARAYKKALAEKRAEVRRNNANLSDAQVQTIAAACLKLSAMVVEKHAHTSGAPKQRTVAELRVSIAALVRR